MEALANKYLSKGSDYYSRSRPEMLEFIPQAGKAFLEVGCSSGLFGAAIKHEIPGSVVWGIEPDQASYSEACERLDNVIHGTFNPNDELLHGKSFDCIVFNDVLEHLVNPEQVLAEAKGLLAPSGVVVASIPNILYFYQIWEILVQQDWRYESSGILDNTHLRFFTKKSILRMFESCGYIVKRIEGINMSVGKKYHFFNLLFLNRLRDLKYEQFAVVAEVRG